MNIKKTLIALSIALTLVSAAHANEQKKSEEHSLAVIDHNSCVQNSKYGKQEQANLDAVRKRFFNSITETQRKMQDAQASLEDAEYMDSISEKKQEELKKERDTLVQKLNRHQADGYQMMQNIQFQAVQKITRKIREAAADLAKESKVPYILNKEACFYCTPSADLTKPILEKMDENFDQEEAKKLAAKEAEEKEAKKALAQTPSEEKAELSMTESQEKTSLPFDESLENDEEASEE